MQGAKKISQRRICLICKQDIFSATPQLGEAAGNLQQGGYIRYRRGHISVLDPKGLQTRACECYAVVKKELARLLSDERYRQDTV